MIGLVYIAAFVVYLVVVFLVVRFAIRWARRNGRTPWKWGWGAGIAMYLVVFWDLLPTVVAHKVLCELKPAIHIYKTVDEWKREHADEPMPQPNRQGELFAKDDLGRDVVLMNSRFASRRTSNSIWPISTIVSSEQVVDIVKQDVMLERVSVHSGFGSLGNSGNWRAMKFWLHLRSCVPSDPKFELNKDEFRRLAADVK